MPSMGTWLSPYLHVFTNLVVSRGYALVVVCGLLIVVASLVAEHGLWGAWSQ